MRYTLTCKFCEQEIEAVYNSWYESVPYGWGRAAMPMTEFYLDHDCPVADEGQLSDWEQELLDTPETSPELQAQLEEEEAAERAADNARYQTMTGDW